MRRLALIGALVATACAAQTSAAPAAEWTRSTAYVCTSLAGLASETADLELRLQTPDGVRAGDTITAEGTLTLGFPSGIRGIVGTLSLARTVRLDLDRTRLPIRIPAEGGTVERSVDLGALTSSPVAAPRGGGAVALTAPVRVPEVVVPADATGDLQIAMPVDGSTPNTVGREPAEVAFTGALTYAGGLPARFDFACRLGADRADVIARVPVEVAAACEAAAPKPAEQEKPKASRTPRRRKAAAGPATSSSGTTAPATRSSGSSGRSRRPARDAEPVADTDAAPPVEETVPAALVEPVPAATRDDHVVVPAWVLAVLLGFVLATSATFAVRDHRRVRTIRQRLRSTP